MGDITEHRWVCGPRVYGYLRLPAPRSARRKALTQAVIGYCERHELLLGGVFTERATSGQLDSPAFAGLLDALAASGGYGVVLPSPAHLGSSRAVICERASLLAETGARLMVIRGRLPAVSPAARPR